MSIKTALYVKQTKIIDDCAFCLNQKADAGLRILRALPISKQSYNAN